jgi:hypothetical protein
MIKQLISGPQIKLAWSYVRQSGVWETIVIQLSTKERLSASDKLRYNKLDSNHQMQIPVKGSSRT